MKHSIDPKIDCVFKALLGSEENKNLLIHFLNAILEKELTQPIVSAILLNPYNDKEFIGDKLSIVDVKAKDGCGHTYQIEIQLKNHSSLSERMAYNWANIYSQQINEGDEYNLLQPTYSIWILAEDIIKHDKKYAHNYKLRDEHGNNLNNHGGIWLLELNKFHQQQITTDEQLWLKFFKEGNKLNDKMLPDWMQTKQMRQAMNTLRAFSEKEHQYDRYHARMEYIRIQNTIQRELERTLLREQIAIQRIEEERKEKEVAIQEIIEERKEKEAVIQEREEERKEKEAAIQDSEESRKEKEAAFVEIERLKALLHLP